MLRVLNTPLFIRLGRAVVRCT